MRDQRFVVVHRGGSLTIIQHRQLMEWACMCVEHVLLLLEKPIDARLIEVLKIARLWSNGLTNVACARNASKNAIAVANEMSDPITKAIAQAVGHAVATAHMSDHSVAAVIYALKALNFVGKSIQAEREWQNEHIPIEVKELVLSNRIVREQHLKLA